MRDAPAYYIHIDDAIEVLSNRKLTITFIVIQPPAKPSDKAIAVQSIV